MAKEADLGTGAVLLHYCLDHRRHIPHAKLVMRKVPVVFCVDVCIEADMLTGVARTPVISKPDIETLLEQKDRQGGLFLI